MPLLITTILGICISIAMKMNTLLAILELAMLELAMLEILQPLPIVLWCTAALPEKSG